MLILLFLFWFALNQSLCAPGALGFGHRNGYSFTAFGDYIEIVIPDLEVFNSCLRAADASMIAGN